MKVVMYKGKKHYQYECGAIVPISVFKTRPKIKEAKDAIPLLGDIRFQRKEHFKVLLLDNQNQVIKSGVVAVGTTNMCVVHPREVFRPAVHAGCTNIIVAHNHPSGELTPSQADIDVTKKLVEAGSILGIKVLDHIIVSNQDFVSLVSEHPNYFNYKSTF